VRAPADVRGLSEQSFPFVFCGYAAFHDRVQNTPVNENADRQRLGRMIQPVNAVSTPLQPCFYRF
jgi:hypothetical protein